MKKKTFLFKKAAFKKTIKKVKHLNNKFYFVVGSNGVASNKLIECCRVTVSRLTRNGLFLYNNQKYKKINNDNIFMFEDLNNVYNYEKRNFDFLKSNMIKYFRKSKYYLKKYKKKEKKKKIKKKLSTNFGKLSKKQKDIYLKLIHRKINYKINSNLNLPLFKRSNKSRMGKGKSKIHSRAKFFSKNEVLFTFDNINKLRKKIILKQLNYKTNFNVKFK